jgi:hypothetical protein
MTLLFPPGCEAAAHGVDAGLPTEAAAAVSDPPTGNFCFRLGEVTGN